MKKLLARLFPRLWSVLVAIRWNAFAALQQFARPDWWRRHLQPTRYKRDAETAFWRGIYRNVTAGCRTPDECIAACIRNSHEDGFVRYQRMLGVGPDSFAGLRVVDVGCGPTSGLIGFTGCEKFGVDHLVDAYREIGFPLDRHGIAYRNARLEATGLPGGSFDRVLCVNALDHVDDLYRSMREIARLLKRGGLFLAQIGFHDKPSPTEPHVIRHDELLRMARQLGLRPLEIRFVDQSSYLDERRYFYKLVKD
jgi:SAM-dependent methyltransferase